MSKKRRERDDSFFGAPFEDAGEGEIPLMDLDEFIVAGRDDRGASATITINIPPALERELEVVLHSRRFPYVTKRDVIRHAVTRHVMWIHLIRQAIPRHFLSMLEAIIEVCRDEDMAIKIEQVFMALQDRVQDHVTKGDDLEAIRLISLVQQKLKELKPSSWSRKYQERFNTRYAGFLRIKKAEKEEEKEHLTGAGA